MKRQMIIFLMLSLSVGFLLMTCNNKIDETLTPTLNPLFEQNPPIAKNVFFQKLKKPTAAGNMVIMAEFEKGAIETPFLVVNSDDGETVLFDNGKNGDEKEGDGIFSAIVQEDEGQIIERFSSINLAKDERRQIRRFVNRVGVPNPPDEIETPIKIEAFQNFEKIKLPPFFFTVTPPDPLLKPHSLMITDVSVVTDPTRTFELCGQSGTSNGVWTFWELMRQMASPNPGSIATDLQTSAFILNWLNTWNMSLTVNGENLPARNAIQSNVIGPWLSRSSGAGAGVLSKDESPFRLIAIVNRLDLRGNSGYGFSDAGEGRFVFSVINPNTCQKLGQGFNVIFEYGINKKSCSAVKAFAQEWHDLKNQTLGSTAYLNALENITMQFTQSGTNPSKPNQNSINQVRTNEFGLGLLPWELREFNLFASGGLQLVTVKQEPAVKYNSKGNNPESILLADFVNSNTAAIESFNYTVPLTHNGQDFLGGKSHTIFPPLLHHWDGGPSSTPAHITSDSARFVFSLTTCSGCHGGETKSNFVHIEDPSSAIRLPANLSGFLTGLGADDNPDPLDIDSDPTGFFYVKDAANRPSGAVRIRGFNDLERRANDLDKLINDPCKGIFNIANKMTFAGTPMTH